MGWGLLEGSVLQAGAALGRRSSGKTAASLKPLASALRCCCGQTAKVNNGVTDNYIRKEMWQVRTEIEPSLSFSPHQLDAQVGIIDAEMRHRFLLGSTGPRCMLQAQRGSASRPSLNPTQRGL